MIKKGLVQIYTGQGKGKTTASLGLALRAAGRGNKVLIFQFLKPADLDLGERIAIQSSNLPITIRTMETSWDMTNDINDPLARQKTAEEIKKNCRNIASIAQNKEYNLIILDEIVFCLSAELISISEIKNIIDSKHESVEIVMTGTGATKELIKLADLVSEIKPIKHPYEKGIKARPGIEY